MSVDKFGRAFHTKNTPNKSYPIRPLPISFTIDGDIDCENRRLCNVKEGRASVDATNKIYVDRKIYDNLQHVKADFKISFDTWTKKLVAIVESYKNKNQKLYEDIERTKSEIAKELQKSNNELSSNI